MTVPGWFLCFLGAGALWANPDATALSDRAQQAAAAQRLDEAERLWREALQESPDFFPALFNLGYLNYSSGKFADSEEWFRKAIRVRRSDFNSHYLLGAALQRMDQRENALREWTIALEIQPRNFKLMQIMAVEYEKGAYFNNAAAMAQRALDLRPADLDAYLIAIHAYQNTHDLETALKIAGEAARRFPGSSRANFEYGFQLQRAGKLQEANVYLKRAMAQDPKYEEPYFFFGDILVAQGNDEQALPYLRKAIAIRNDYLDAHLTLARALMHLENWRPAKEELEVAARLDPRRPEPHILLSRVYFRLGDQDRAAEEKRISEDLRYRNPDAGESVQGRTFPSK